MANNKYKKGPTKEEKEALSKKKKFESKWINKHCFDTEPLKLSKASLGLKQLRFGIINSHRLASIQLGIDTIQLKSSWIEFIIIMLSQIIDENKENFKEIFGKYGVTNNNFCVENVYGSYSFDSQGYKVYKIYDSGYYLEIKEESRIIFNAIISLIRALEIDPASMKFNVVSNELSDKPEEKLKESLNYKTDKADINEVEQRILGNEHLAYIKIFDEVTEVHRLDIALLAFCNIIYDKYGLTELMSIPNDTETGICLNELSANYPCSRIRNSVLLVYTSGHTKSIIRFIKNSMIKLNIKDKDITFSFKANSSEKHEWEVD